MKIAVIGLRGIPSCYGGIEKHCEEIYSRLVKSGHKITIFVRSEFINPEYKPPKGITLKPVWTVRSKHLATPVHSFFSLLYCIFANFDIIHFHAQGPCIFAWMPKLFNPKTKLVFTCHGIDWKRNKWNFMASGIIKLGEVLSAKLFQNQIVVSDDLHDYYRKTYSINPIKITNGSNIASGKLASIIRKEYGLEEKSYILSIGRLVPEKSIHKLIEIYKRITPDRTDKKLVIAGAIAATDSYGEYLKDLAKDDKRIIFTGMVEGETLKEIYSNAYLYVSASDLEGLPLTLLEAMSYGVPALVSNIPPHVEMIEDDEENGYIFYSSRLSDMKQKLESVLSIPAYQLTEMGIKGREKIRIDHNWEDVTRKHELVYKLARV